MNLQRPSSLIAMIICCSLLLGGNRVANAQRGGASLETLTSGETAHGFRVVSIYLNDADRPMGGRFVHARTGFTFDVLQIQSVPQGFIWVNSFPTSDMGEPHTQEHLLLGKGNKGRSVASLEDMSLADSTAFTQQWRTAYPFHTAAGPEVFFSLFESKVDALLHPNYSDEEIRREVRNFGVTENPKDKTLRLEEKGSVYNEMVSSSDNPFSRLFRVINHTLYGRSHPLAYSSGGWPAAIREMQPEHIRKFHRENYHLGNMGMVGSFPKEMALGRILRRMDEILNRLEPDAGREKRLVKTEADLPAPQMGPTGSVQVAEYPHKNDQQPGPLVLAWPASLKFDSNEEWLLLDLFVENLSGDATTNIYKRFVDTKTREMDLGAKGAFGFVSDDQGHPVFVGLSDVAPSHMNEAKIKTIRQKVLDEITRITTWPDGAPELAEFNARLRNRVTQTRRSLSKFVNSPAGFGFRSGGSAWLDQLHRLSKTKDFRKSVTMKQDLAFVEKLLAGKENFWRSYIAKWKLTETTPYAFAARPSPALLAQEEKERQDRIAAETARLKARYGTNDEQEAIQRYRAEYDAETAKLDEIAKQDKTPRFVEAPPLTLDDQLDYTVSKLSGDIPLVAANFDNMTSATTGIALRLDGVPEDELIYLSMLPALLTGVGVIENGRSVSYEQMTERLRQEILNLNAGFSTNYRTGRAELVVRGAGNDAREAQRAVEWMRLVLMHPNWRPENLPRIRDLVDQTLNALRNTTRGPEETWVNNPANAYRRQDSPLLLTIDSFLTRAHNVHRLRWMLKDAGTGPEREAITAYLDRLANAAKEAGRSDLKTLLAAMQGDAAQAGKLSPQLKPYHEAFGALPTGAKALAVEAAKDLDQLLTDIPDATLMADWAYLCGQMRHDLLIAPEQALSNLEAVRRRVLKTGNARLFVIGARSTQKGMEGNIRALVAGLETAPASRVAYSNTPLVKSRLRARLPEANAPVYVGLVSPNTRGGVFLNSAPLATYDDTDRESLLNFLAAKLYGGGGAHGIFMKTWGAGLAYSNGLGSSPNTGRVTYYAERTPELPQTLRFVIDELKKAPRDPNLVEYTIAQAFGEFRSASSYEARGEAIAADLADGVTPEVVSRFRKAILELRGTPQLADELYKRMDNTYARVLPGYGVKGKEVAGGIYYVIGPEKQLELYEEYLKSVEGPETRLYRLYPRDYWMTSGSAMPVPGAPKR